MKKGEQTRQAIIEKAAPLFNQRGFAGCSMTDIMEATGLEKGGLYRHFESKEDLAAAVLRYSLKAAIESRSGGDDIEGDAIARLRLMISRFVSVPSPVAGGCPLLNTAIDTDMVIADASSWVCAGTGLTNGAAYTVFVNGSYQCA